MALLSLQDFQSWARGAITKATPIRPTMVAATFPAGDTFPLAERTYIVVSNPTGGAIDVLVQHKRLCNYGTGHDLTVTVPAGAVREPIGPLDPDRFADNDGRAQAFYSATGLTVAVVQL